MNILIVEDDRRLAELIKRGLEEQDYATEVAFDGFTGHKLAMNNSYDLIITDIILPKVNGIELCKEIREVKPNIPIIMLTALGSTNDKVEGFDAGADDYLVKPFDFRELHARIKALMKRNAGKTNESAVILSVADLKMNLYSKVVIRNKTEINLTPKEFKLLEYLMKNPNRVLSRGEIAENVWGTTFDTGTNFIDVYINYIRKKIDKDFPVKLIHTKPGMGFILKDEE